MRQLTMFKEEQDKAKKYYRLGIKRWITTSK